MTEAKKTAKKSSISKEKQVKHAEIVAEATPADNAQKAEITIEKSTAKAGKRSSKSLKEAEEKQAKENRKSQNETRTQKTKPEAKPSRTKAERASKKYREAAKLIDKSKVYPLTEALDLAVKTSPTKFDGTIEMHVNLEVDPKQADQNVRDTVALPAGTGKDIKVEVLEESSADKIFGKLDKEVIDFDVLIASPDMMPRLGKYARLLGPRGLMPNPRSGTVSQDPASAAKEAKAGKVEYRVDQAGIIHLAIGKVSFGSEKLSQNAEAVLGSIRAAKPASIKGVYIKSAYLASTMGPSVKIEV